MSWYLTISVSLNIDPTCASIILTGFLKGFSILWTEPKGVLSLQKHYHRSEHWVITQGTPKITLNKKKFILKPNETIFIPVKSIHRIENPYKKPVKIIEAQVGSILKETDIVRYQDIYGRVKWINTTT